MLLIKLEQVLLNLTGRKNVQGEPTCMLIGLSLVREKIAESRQSESKYIEVKRQFTNSQSDPCTLDVSHQKNLKMKCY